MANRFFGHQKGGGGGIRMCGRFLLTTPAEALRQAFGFVEQPNLAPRYNIAPTQDVPVIRQRKNPSGERTLQMLRWGLVPSWAESLAGGAKMINARAETLTAKSAFRNAFGRRRCLVPADGFYEWRPGDKAKQPYLIAARDGGPSVDSFTIVTTAANACLAPLHHRMPVIVAPADYARWLDPATDPSALQSLLRPAPDDLLHYRPVDRRVNNVRNDDAALLRPETPA